MRILGVLLIAFSLQAQEAPALAAPAPNVEEDFTRAVFFGKKFADMADYASAYENLASADALKPDQPAVLYNMGVVLARAGRYSEAQVKVDRYLQLFPAGEEKANVQRLQFELQFQRELQKKRQADQEYAELFNRARFLYGRAELDESLKLFRQAEQLRPTDAAAVFNQALVYEKQGDFAKAVERYRRYSEVESDADAKSRIDEHVYELQHELEDMRTKVVCSFCGRKLTAGSTWCERCWHGPYAANAVWNTRSCAEGASATRATYFADGRFDRNDILPCMFKGPNLLEALRYTPARQREIRDARRAEGWTFVNDALQGWADKQGNQIRYIQGPEYLEKVTSTLGGEILTYVAHPGGEGIWLLDREDLIIDAQRFTSRYSFDASGRIAQQQVEYQNTAACNHLISMIANYTYTGDALSSVALSGGYEGYQAEGKPKTEWTANVAYTYDDKARVTREELAVTSLNKTYDAKPIGALRDDIQHLYQNFRVRRPLETAPRQGDLCASAGSQTLANFIDLRPFYAMSPNLGVALQNGINKAVVTFTYPAP
jgi:tetratricopeptide (TPR) repeat protein